MNKRERVIAAFQGKETHRLPPDDAVHPGEPGSHEARVPCGGGGSESAGARSDRGSGGRSGYILGADPQAVFRNDREGTSRPASNDLSGA